MKAWLKGGVIAVIIYILIVLISFAILLLSNSTQAVIWPILLYLPSTLITSSLNYLDLIINTLFYFIIGAIIVLIVDKFRTKSKKVKNKHGK